MNCPGVSDNPKDVALVAEFYESIYFSMWGWMTDALPPIPTAGDKS